MSLVPRATPFTRARQRQIVKVGQVSLGGDLPVVVQSMTNTDTADIDSTVQQIIELAEAGSELVRITVNNDAAAAAVPFIKERLEIKNVRVPIVGDFHFNGHRLLSHNPACAEALDKYRINPGNVGRGAKKDIQFSEMIEIACRYDKPVRIGVNWGSLDQTLLAKLLDQNSALEQPLELNRVMQDTVIQSALESAAMAESVGMARDRIILSCKTSHVQDLITIYRRLAADCDYALHLGLTEAGMGSKGIVASTAALSVLLQDNIGDTIRISLTPEPGVSRDKEVKTCKVLLQSMGLRYFMPKVTSCPGCGRTNSDKFVILADEVTQYIEEKMPIWKQSYPGVEKLSVAVMGCVVNGPGESKYADIGISLPGSSEKPSIPIYQDGKLFKTLKGDSPSVKEDYIIYTLSFS